MKFALTPFPPRGIVQILEERGDYTTVRYLHTHYGYPAGSHGAYPSKELKPLPEQWQQFAVDQVLSLDSIFDVFSLLASNLNKEEA